MNKVIKWMILLVFLLESRFFYLFSLPEFIKRYNTYLNKAIIVGLILFGMIIIGIMTRYRYFKKLNFNKFILALLALYVVEFVISLLKYNQGIKYVYSSSCHLLIVLFYYILMYYAIKKGNLKYIWMCFKNNMFGCV